MAWRTRTIAIAAHGTPDMPLLTEIGRRLGVCSYKHATPTEWLRPVLIPLKTSDESHFEWAVSAD